MSRTILSAGLLLLAGVCGAAEQSGINLWQTYLRSEDPSFRFFFKPRTGGTITVATTDSKRRQFTRSFDVDGGLTVLAR